MLSLGATESPSSISVAALRTPLLARLAFVSSEGLTVACDAREALLRGGVGAREMKLVLAEGGRGIDSGAARVSLSLSPSRREREERWE